MATGKCYLIIRTAAFGCLTLIVFIPSAAAQLTVQQLIGTAVPDGADHPKYDDIRAALGRFATGEPDSAYELFKTAYTRNPELPPPGVLMAQLFVATGNIGAARFALEKATHQQSDDPEAFIAFGELALRDSHFTDADLLFRRGAELVGDYTANPARVKSLKTRAVVGLAAVANYREDWPAAEELLRQWLAFEPRNHAVHDRLAQALFLQEKEREAYEMFQERHDLLPTSPRPEISMAVLYERRVEQGKQEMRAKAKQLVELAVQRDGENPRTRLAAAEWALDAGDLDFARQCVDVAVKAAPNDFEVLLLAGRVARFRKDLDAAEAALQQAVVRAPGNFDASNQLTLVLIEQPNEAKRKLALGYAELNGRAFGSELNELRGREAVVTLAWVHYQMGRDTEAQRLVKGAVAAGTLSPDSAYHAARILHGGEQVEMAQRLLRSSLEKPRPYATRPDAEALLQKLEQRR